MSEIIPRIFTSLIKIIERIKLKQESRYIKHTGLQLSCKLQLKKPEYNKKKKKGKWLGTQVLQGKTQYCVLCDLYLHSINPTLGANALCNPDHQPTKKGKKKKEDKRKI